MIIRNYFPVEHFIFYLFFLGGVGLVSHFNYSCDFFRNVHWAN